MNIQEATSSISQPSTGVKAVALYCRVSTEDQEREGTSLDTQRAACLDFCEEHNYIVTHQFLETWSGLSLERPKLDELRQLVRNGEIAGVVIYCLDRLSRKPVHGVILTEELEKHNATLEAVIEDIDNSELGKLINYIKGYAASLEAEKIRERTMRGTKARVFGKKLPVTKREPFGYSWSGERCLEPNGDYETVKLILAMAIDGKSYDYIIGDLKKRAILSPSGLPDWNKCTISSIIRNPVYAGRFYAFKSEVKAPKRRKNGSFGNSSVKRLPMEQWHYISEIEVVNPPMTWGQRALLLDQLKQRQKLAQRNAKRDYLLRGMVLCGTHKGKNGEPRVYHGMPKRQTWYYKCPVGGCSRSYIPGPNLEGTVKFVVQKLFQEQPDEYFSKQESKADVIGQLKNELGKLKTKVDQIHHKEALLEDDRYSNIITTESYEILKERYQLQKVKILKHQDIILGQLATLQREKDALLSWEELRRAYTLRLFSFTDQEWRDLFERLKIQLHVGRYSTKTVKFANWIEIVQAMNEEKTNLYLGTEGALVLQAAIPVTLKETNIALHSPEASQHNPQYYPLRFPLSDITTIPELASIPREEITNAKR